jgi:hypothetical protein
MRDRRIRLLAPLALLSPRIISVIADGAAPPDFTVTSLAKALPYSWAEQERTIHSMFRDQFNTRVLLGNVTDIDARRRQVILQDLTVPFDYLVVATGATHSYFGKDAWARYAPGLKGVDDATAIRRRVLEAFERAEIRSRTSMQKVLLSRTNALTRSRCFGLPASWPRRRQSGSRPNPTAPAGSRSRATFRFPISETCSSSVTPLRRMPGMADQCPVWRRQPSKAASM